MAILHQRKFATKHKFYIDAWCLTVTQAKKHVKYGHWWHKHNAAKSDAKVTKFEMNAMHNKRRSDQVFKMSSTSFHTSSSAKNMKSKADAGNDVAVFVREFGATHS